MTVDVSDIPVITNITNTPILIRINREIMFPERKVLFMSFNTESIMLRRATKLL